MLLGCGVGMPPRLAAGPPGERRGAAERLPVPPPAGSQSNESGGKTMATTPQSGMIGRIKAILMDPKNEFQRIDAEPATVSGIMTGWVAPLAAIGPLAGLIGMMAFAPRGVSFGGVTVAIAPSMTFLIANAVSQYVLALVGAFVCALIVDALAPSFGGQKDRVKAMKLVAYGSTAAYLAGIFAIMPMLAILSIVGLYSLYLFYVGLPVLMKSPADKTVVYLIVIVVVYIVVMIVAGVLVRAITAPFAPAATSLTFG